MSESATPLRVLFCIGINQNFFDLPTERIGDVLTAFTEMTNALAALPGVRVLGTMDDDQHMVGPSAQWPWTCYILAEVADQPTVAAACGLFRSTPVGEHALWRYAKIEARIGRPLGFPDEVGAAAERTERR
ncbi:hypothetical protein BAY61_14225 [Prauserella marina]|uniref:Uncharacterized protein n=1 Tax=Prauserella marina TaxID=530584 RepID=A0A222VPW6_9PSEU|nr:hypothetical protein [Prauserella marina]ASR35966.1 hypothetical protein BAY61_14225 [Prauserella marina]PWV84095.1 hypothetical protein DES30_101112 [Prauserella marina]SDC30462.1 hypothetical protein SAMN05421630_1011225 [Prauserella marina]